MRGRANNENNLHNGRRNNSDVPRGVTDREVITEVDSRLGLVFGTSEDGILIICQKKLFYVTLVFNR